MNILGVHSGHNASACVFVAGKLVAAIQEERLTRIKNHTGFPTEAIQCLLQEVGLTIAEFAQVAYTDVYRIVPEVYLDRQAAQAHFSREPSTLSMKLVPGMAERIRPVGEIATNLRLRRRASEFTKHGIPIDKLVRVDHHLAHAAAAYYGWGKYDRPVLVLTCDGRGDGLCATASVGENGRLTRIASVPAPYSIGLLYAMTTMLLGMKPNEHEYKLMGMAPYAHKQDGSRLAKKFASYLEPDPNNPLGWRTTNGMRDTYWSYRRLRQDLEFERFDAICAGLQLWIEDFLADWVQRCIQHTGISRLALAGGVFMNVKANKRIMELEGVEELFVFPSCGDETNPIGACYYVHAQQNGVGDLEPIGSFCLGTEFSEVQMREEIDRIGNGFDVERPADLPGRIAELLARGHVVARFAGQDEFGARALGNRSILANPSRPEVVRVVNDMIKNRDFWMPFACSIRSERADDYLVNPKRIPAPYMIMTFDTTQRRQEIAAGTHPYDGTARPQVVYREHNPEYHQILTEFEKITGIGGILNTSFNLHGYPIVHSPKDALEVMNSSALQFLALGPYLVSKVKTSEATPEPTERL